MKPFLIILAAAAIGSSAAHAAINTDWAAFKVADRVELDSACTGNWSRVEIEAIGTDAYNAKARKFTIRREDGSNWTFSAPSIVAPCMHALSAAAAQPVQAAGPAQPLQGLYLQLQPTGTAYAYIHYYFWKDGRVCNGLPLAGVDREPADFGTLQQHQTCGRYRIAGDHMSLQFQGQTKSHDVSLRHFHADGFEMNGYTTTKVASFVAERPAEGTYTATVVGNQTTRQAYVFHADGTYEFSSKPLTARDGAPHNAAGTYRFSDNTLHLTGAHGPRNVTAYPFPGGGLMIAGSIFARS